MSYKGIEAAPFSPGYSMDIELDQSELGRQTAVVPNFFVVGFPKCGTTTLYENLRRHPDVFMPWSADDFWITKEPNFFDTDLEIDHRFSIKDESAYLDLFSEAGDSKRVGEATTFYIYSDEAPRRIFEMNPAAKIIIILRNPVDMLVSWHSDCYRWGHEDILDFEAALDAETDRLNGLRIPLRCYYPKLLQYSKMGKYAQHIARYLDIFGPSQVKVILLDDLQHHPEQLFRDIFEYLDIDRNFQIDKENHNPSIKLSRIHQSTLRFWEGYGEAKAKLPMLPEPFWSVMGKVFDKLFMSAGTIDKPVIGSELRRRLVDYYREELKEVEKLIDRDLSAWQ